jgi:hypothetical protein
MRGFVAWLAPVVGILAVACSSSISGGPPVNAAQACADVADALCQKLDSCTAFLIQDVYGDVNTCSVRVAASCQNGLAATGTGLTPALYESCVKQIPGATCDDVLDNNVPSVCQAAKGQLANGTTCGDSSQCQSTYCNLGKDGACGACGPSRGDPGAACNRDDDCSYGSTCSDSGTCVTPVATGGTCDTTHPCRPTLACKAGVCAAPDEAGAACTTGTCDNLAGLYCGVQAHPVCTMIALATAGQPCGVVNGGLTACSVGGACNGGTCQAYAADGTACDDTTGPPCLAPAVCVATSKLCTLPAPANCH